MRRYAIQNPKGRFNYFRDSACESKDAVVDRMPFGTTWDSLVRDGYRCVKVEVKVLEDCSQGSLLTARSRRPEKMPLAHR